MMKKGNNPNSIKTYTELKQLKTFEERFKYLKLNGRVGEETFGFDRYVNQKFYRSSEWKQLRNHIIVRDNGCDLGIEDKDIYGRVYIHHMNPISVKDIDNVSEYLLNPEYLVVVSHDTHNAIHYGDESYLKNNQVITRTKNDTVPWKK